MDEQNNRNTGDRESTRELFDRLDALLNEDWRVSLPELDPAKSSTSGLPDGFSLSADESSDITTIMADIVTYVTEKALKFVTGEIELNETTYQEYKDDINDMRLGEALAIMEGAYERYLAE